jgi:hypothetical protein
LAITNSPLVPGAATVSSVAAGWQKYRVGSSGCTPLKSWSNSRRESAENDTVWCGSERRCGNSSRST